MRVCVLIAFAALGGCGSRGVVSFDIRTPAEHALDPLADAHATGFLVRAADGTLLGAASGTMGSLPLGALMPTTSGPRDVEFSIVGGTELLGMARIRNVVVQPGVEVHYPADVRKPFFFVGSVPPLESNPGNHLNPVSLIDPATTHDLAGPLGLATRLRDGASASAVTSDGRYLLIGHTNPNALSVVDTGSAQLLGELSLPYPPARITVAARDRAAAVLDAGEPDGHVLLFPDVASLVANPASAVYVRAALPGQTPRNAVFSPDGATLYVLGASGAVPDPCAPPAPPADAIQLFGLDGSSPGKWQLSAFATDLAIDHASGRIVVTLPLAGQLAAIAPTAAFGAVTPQLIAGGLTCPTALHLDADSAYVVTAKPDRAATTSYHLERLSLSGAAPVELPFVAPVYEGAINQSQTPDMKVNTNLQLRPSWQHAYELTVAPDGSRALFATRTRYSEKNQHFDLIAGFTCNTNVEVVEYGRYTLDTRTSTASYEVRSQLVVSPPGGQRCVECQNGFFAIVFNCTSFPGDRAAGLSTVFGNP